MIDDTLLTAYALNELNAADRAAVEAHLTENPADRQAMVEIQATAWNLSTELATELQGTSAGLPIRLPVRRRRWAAAAIGLAASAAIAAGVGVYFYQDGRFPAVAAIIPKPNAVASHRVIVNPTTDPVMVGGTPAKTQVDDAHVRAIAAQTDRDARYRVEREKTITGLIADVRQYYDEQKYTEALAVVDNIQRLDPNNMYASDIRQMIEDKANNQTSRKYTEDPDREFGKTLKDPKVQGAVVSGNVAGGLAATNVPITVSGGTIAAGTQANPVSINARTANTTASNSGFAPLSITQNQVTDGPTFRDANGNVVANGQQGGKTLDWVSNAGNAAVPGSVQTVSSETVADAVVVGNVSGLNYFHGQKLGTGGYTLEPGQQSLSPNNESYSRIVDNPFLASRQAPLSTFAVDVDTASYANVRRFIEQGQIPPADAVRIEELVNYFPYDTPGPKANDPSPVNVNVEVADCPWQPTHRLARVALKAKVLAGHKRPPSNLVFLLDISGSMQDENKLPLVKTALKKLVNRLSATDRVSIVTYASTTQVLLPSTACGDDPVGANVDGAQLWQDAYLPRLIVKNGVTVNEAKLKAEFATDVANRQRKTSGRQQILEAIDSLSADGSTDGGDGIQLAYKTAVDHFMKEGTNRVILATDGDFNVGIVDPTQLTKLIETEAGTGVYLSVLGVGMGNVKDSTMEKLADHGKGNYAYLDSVEEADKVLGRQIDATLVTVAKDVKLQVEFNPATVAAYRLIGYEDRAMANKDFNNDKKGAGEMGAGHSVIALYELVPANNTGRTVLLKYQPAPTPATKPTDAELMTVNVRYQPSEGGESRKLEFPVIDNPEASANASSDFRFSAAVASFGMILRNSPYRGGSTLDQVIDQASGARGEDIGGYRSQFVELVKRTKSITGK